MAKPEGWRLNLAAYPIILESDTRFQDMDINGHLNNVAFASLFENARVQLHRKARPWADRPDNERTMVASVEINYLREGNFQFVIVCRTDNEAKPLRAELVAELEEMMAKAAD